jgi:UDP-N-acetylglucosamine--N-acetylmuramyl-(pentapeptide) pyrophosphoryl-undecaprenol N-acetylglucosamine transferase
MRILFVGGGSIGHIAPSVAVWRAIEAEYPGTEAHFICSERTEDADFLRRERVPFTSIRGRSLPFFRPDIIVGAFLRGRSFIAQWKPDIVFSKGGALSVPICFAAKKMNVPIVMHESDAVSGRANSLVSRWAAAVCTGFPTPATREKFARQHSNVVFTGNPVRPDVVNGSRDHGFDTTGFDRTRPVLLVMGGSQGAQALNAAVSQHVQELLQCADIIHLTGKGKEAADPQAHYWSAEFAHAELPHLYAIADFALSRAGAGSISELAACHIPAILVPLPHLAHDHQTKNADVASRTGACIALPQSELRTALVPTVQMLAKDSQKREQMRTAMTALSVADAAKRIAKIVMDTGYAHKKS